MFKRQIAKIVKESDDRMDLAPTLIGEFGIPFNNNGSHFRTGNYARHGELLDMQLSAMEENLAHYTLWNYTPNNTHEHGDNWNREDLSIYSRGGIISEKKREHTATASGEDKVMDLCLQNFRGADDRVVDLCSYRVKKQSKVNGNDRTSTRFEFEDLATGLPLKIPMDHMIFSGGRGLEGVIRPFPLKTCGRPRRSVFYRSTRTYALEFRSNPEVDQDHNPTEIFVPLIQFPNGFEVHVSDGTVSVVEDPDFFVTVKYKHDEDRKGKKHWVTITDPRSNPLIDWGNYKMMLGIILAVAVAIAIIAAVGF